MAASTPDVDQVREALHVLEDAAHEVVEEHLDPVETVLLLRSISQVGMYGLAALEGAPERPRRVIEGELGVHFSMYLKMCQILTEESPTGEWWYDEGP